MSKNTGTSELINYFDLGVNGDVGIAGSLDINTIANATTDTDTFLVSDTGIIKYRTGAQLLSDIGAAPATGGSYLPLTGGILTGTTRMDGSGGTVPSITMIYNSGINRLLAPLLRLYGATNEASNYIELFGTLATSNRTINFPDASGTVALTSNIPANPVGGTGTAGQVTYWSSSSEITGISNFLFNASERNLTIDRSLSTLGNAITISKGSDVDQAWLAFRQGGGGNGTWRLGYTGDPYDFTINVGTDSSIGAQTLRIFEDSQNVVVGTAIVDNGTKLQVGGSVNIVGNGSQLLFDSLGQSKSGGIYYTNDFELLINNSRGSGSAIYLGNVNMDFHTNVSGNPRLRITSGGNILVGTTTDNGARLQLGGFSGAVNQNNGIKLTNNVGTIVGLEIGGSNDSYIGTISASNFSIRTANTPIITVASGGNVGIGTTSPSTKLNLYNATTQTQLIITGGDTSNQRLEVTDGTVTNRFGIFGRTNGDAGVLGTQTNHPLIFNTNNTERMRITSGGDVYLNNAAALFFGPTSVTYLTGSTTNMIFAVNTGERMRITSGGDVCIGITSALQPAANRGSLSINGVSSSILSFGVGSATKAYLYTGGTTLTVESVGASADMVFAAGNADRLKITSSGNVLIGTTTDSGYKLRVNGMSYLDGYNYASSIQYTRAVSNTVNPAGGEGVLIFSGGQAAMRMDSSYTMNFDMYNSGTQHTALQIRQNGNTVSINSPNNSLPLELKFQNVASGYLGAISSALYAYSTNGGYVLLNSSSAWVPASDIKRKRNFEPYTKGLSAILGLQPKLYNMDFQQDGDEKQVGLVAQEVREFIPLAYEENADFIGINYNAVIVTMVKAIQEQQQQIQELKNKLS